jgi:hypothetical protein
VLAVLAAFFCLLFFAAAKKSRCRPAQGQRVKHEGITRMPAQRPKHQTATPEARRQYADASANAKQPNRLRSKHASEKQKKQTAHTAKVPREL